MALNVFRNNRKNLSVEQKDFLVKAKSWSETISNWTYEKAVWMRRSVICTIHPAIVLADMIVESQWSTHPLSRDYYNKRYSNNLTLIPVDDVWQGKIQKYDGQEYKAFDGWSSFSADYSDTIVFQREEILLAKDFEEQIHLVAAYKPEPKVTAARIASIIDFYELQDLFP